MALEAERPDGTAPDTVSRDLTPDFLEILNDPERHASLLSEFAERHTAEFEAALTAANHGWDNRLRLFHDILDQHLFRYYAERVRSAESPQVAELEALFALDVEPGTAPHDSL